MDIIIEYAGIELAVVSVASNGRYAVKASDAVRKDLAEYLEREVDWVCHEQVMRGKASDGLGFLQRALLSLPSVSEEFEVKADWEEFTKL